MERRGMTNNKNTAGNPLEGKAPVPDQLKDKIPAGEHPNASAHFDNDPAWKKRPGQYPATKTDKSDPASKKT